MAWLVGVNMNGVKEHIHHITLMSINSQVSIIAHVDFRIGRNFSPGALAAAIHTASHSAVDDIHHG